MSIATLRRNASASNAGSVDEQEPSVTLVVAVVHSTLSDDMLIPPEPILFAFAKADLREQLHPALDDLVRWLNTHPEAALVEVGGHTDDVGGVAYNQALSERRARAIEAALIERGVAPERLMSRGYGLSRPISMRTDDEGRQRNRRVELTVLDWSNR